MRWCVPTFRAERPWAASGLRSSPRDSLRLPVRRPPLRPPRTPRLICSRPTTWRTCPRRGVATTLLRSSTPSMIRPPNPTSPSTAPSTACRRAPARMGASPSSTSPATPHRCRRRTRHGNRRCRSTSTRYQRCAPIATSCSSRRPRPAPPICRPRWRPRQPRGPIRSRPAGPSPSTASCPAHMCSRTSRPSRPAATPAISGPPSTTIRRRSAA